MQSYIVNGVRSKSARSKIALYQPLTLLDLVVYHRENANLNRIKEVKCFYPYQHLPTDVRRATVAMFINEIINKTIREESHAGDLCEFLIQSLMALDQPAVQPENFHLIFLIKLCRFLGFGVYSHREVLGGRVSSADIEEALDKLIAADYAQPFSFSLAQRRELMDLLLKFYADHIDTLGEIRSVSVLREVIN